MRKFNIVYKDDLILPHSGKVRVDWVKIGAMQEADDGAMTIELRDYPKSVFYVQEDKPE